jgi:hypothetical protein
LVLLNSKELQIRPLSHVMRPVLRSLLRQAVAGTLQSTPPQLTVK